MVQREAATASARLQMVRMQAGMQGGMSHVNSLLGAHAYRRHLVAIHPHACEAWYPLPPQT